MLYMAYFIIVSGHNIKKMFCKILLPPAVHVEERRTIGQLVS